MQTVLVVDDDKEIVQAIRIYLEKEGLQVIPAYNGMEAMDILTRQQVHLILLDIMTVSYTHLCRSIQRFVQCCRSHGESRL